jgi:hypothetical protein
MEFPKLLWSAGGVEVTVVSQVEQDARTAEGYTLTAPGPAAPETAPVETSVEEPPAEEPPHKRRGR